MKISFLVLAACLSVENLFARAKTKDCLGFRKTLSSVTATKQFQKFLKAQWEYQMVEYPDQATYLGWPGQNDRLTDLSWKAIERRRENNLCQTEVLQKIKRTSLKEQDRVSYDLNLRDLKISIEGSRFKGDYLVLNHMNGVQIDIPDLFLAMPKNNLKDYQNILSRLEKIPELIDQTLWLLQEGLKQKVTPVQMFLRKVPAQFDILLTEDISKSPLYGSFVDIQAGLDAEQKAQLQNKAKYLLQEKVYPAYKKLKEFLVKTYIPQAQTATAWTAMPDGQKWYEFFVRYHTTLNRTPQELHDLGLSEVARIQKEMLKIKDEVKFKGDLKAFNQFLLKDDQFYFKQSKDLMSAYRDFAKQIDAELPKYFRRLPRLTYGVREMAAYKSAAAPTAYYQNGSIEGGRPGYFEANTYNLRARPKWGIEALTLHEAVPGHHLQIALAAEIEDLPDFRKNASYTSYVEGWALYAESLGTEMGFYKDPYSHYGQLAYEMWRAVRLVVDTGMHQLGWSREKALNYFMELLPKSRLESEVEIDRYITWPGQALAYKVGQLKISELRARAEKALGATFDLREFHDEILKNGAIPMDLLEQNINDWLKKKSK